MATRRKTKGKFELSRASTGNTTDARGTVRVLVLLTNSGQHVKGNITKSLTLADAKVSDVYAAIKEALV